LLNLLLRQLVVPPASSPFAPSTLKASAGTLQAFRRSLRHSGARACRVRFCLFLKIPSSVFVCAGSEIVNKQISETERRQELMSDPDVAGKFALRRIEVNI
jgi:hypothetical protein